MTPIKDSTRKVECKIWVFPTAEDRSGFLRDLRKTYGPKIEYSTALDTDKSKANRHLAAVPIRCLFQGGKDE